MKRNQEKYLVKWKCEECQITFTTDVEGPEADQWSLQNLPEIPKCLECGGRSVFYREHEEISAGMPKELPGGKQMLHAPEG